MTSLQRVFKITPAWKDEVPKRYGQHGAHAIFVVKGPAGSVEVDFNLGWLFDMREQIASRVEGKWPQHIDAPSISNVQAHKIADESDFEAEPHELHEGCAYLPEGETCRVIANWRDQRWFHGLLQGGSDWLWGKMEDWYREIFENGPKTVLEWTPITIDAHGKFLSPHSQDWEK